MVVGACKMASFDDVGKRLVLYDQRVELRDGTPLTIRHAGDSVPFADDEPRRRECEAFLAAIHNAVLPSPTGSQGSGCSRFWRPRDDRRLPGLSGPAVRLPARCLRPPVAILFGLGLPTDLLKQISSTSTRLPIPD